MNTSFLARQAAIFFLLLFKINFAAAFTVWAVDGGADPGSNSPGSILSLSEGLNQIDLYFNTDSDSSIGWDISLIVEGTGTISGVSGGDINGGLGAIQSDGFRQLGGSPVIELTGSDILLFSLTFDADAGAVLSLGNISNYTSGSTFETVSIDQVVLAAAPVPLPASGLLFVSAFSLLFGARRALA